MSCPGSSAASPLKALLDTELGKFGVVAQALVREPCAVPATPQLRIDCGGRDAKRGGNIFGAQACLNHLLDFLPLLIRAESVVCQCVHLLTGIKKLSYTTNLLVCNSLIGAAEGKTRVTLLTNTAANAVNLIFNYFLIQGNCGFPRLAVKGAAIATSLGSFAALAISLYSVRKGNGGILHLDLKQEPFRLDLPLLKKAWDIASSAFHEQFFQRLGVFVFARIAASLGTVEFAIYQFVMNLANLQGYTYDGFASAATALTGQSLGMKEPERAQQAGKYAVWMGYGTAFVIAFGFALFHRPILAIFAKGDSYVIQHGGMLLLFVAAGCIPCSGSSVYAGILRGAGDTKVVARITLWVVAILRPIAAWLFCYPMRLYQVGIWAAFTLAHTLRWICLYLHWRKGTWKQIKL